MATSHKSCLAVPILLAIKNKVAMNHLVSSGQMVLTATSILEGLVVVQLSKFQFKGLFPEGVPIDLVQGTSFLDIPWNLDSKLVTNSRVLGLTAGLVQHASQVFGPMSEAA